MIAVDWVAVGLFVAAWVVVAVYMAALLAVRVRYTDRKDKDSRSHRAGGDTSKGVPTE